VTRPGWVRVDCHLHTAASGDAVTSLEQLADRVSELELDVICITDHNVTSAAVAAAERDIGARVVIGEEIRTPDGDVIGLFLTERIPYVLPLAEVVTLIRSQGGLVYLPHPFDPGRSSLGERTGGPTSSRFSMPRSRIRPATTRPPGWRSGTRCRERPAPTPMIRTASARPTWR
jgi:predicted metal-dependent phosphoesterase TrpH